MLGHASQKPLEITLRYNDRCVKSEEIMDIQALEIGFSSRSAAYRTNWLPFDLWLDKKIATWPAVPALVARWEKAHPSFRFFDLPGELRNKIYKEITGYYIWPHRGWSRVNPKSTPSWVRTFDFDSSNRGEAHFTRQFQLDPSGLRPPSATALPLVSKRVKSEFEHVLWEHTIKHFEGPLTVESMIPLMQETVPYQSLTRVSFGFSNESFLNMVGLSVTNSGALSTHSAKSLEAFDSITGLRHLHLHFQTGPPVFRTRYFNGDPWRHHTLPNVNLPCQKFMVDLILSFALYYIRHIPKITISGHIKNSTRAKWEAIFEDERRGVMRDPTERMIELLEMTGSRIHLQVVLYPLGVAKLTVEGRDSAPASTLAVGGWRTDPTQRHKTSAMTEPDGEIMRKVFFTAAFRIQVLQSTILGNMIFSSARTEDSKETVTEWRQDVRL